MKEELIAIGEKLVVFSEELAANKLAAKTMLDVSKIINPILDEVCYIFSSIYVDSNN